VGELFQAAGRPDEVVAAGLPDDVTPYYLRRTYASLRIAERRLSLQEIAEELGHSLEILAEHHAHVISQYAGKGKLDPEKLIREARNASCAATYRGGRDAKMDAKSATNRGE
jgi:hypothetical protein